MTMSQVSSNDKPARPLLSNEHQLHEIAALIRSAPTAQASLSAAMTYLHNHRQDYHWVGVYRLDGDTLILGPYCGPVTDHVRIPVGRGVCGTAVAENRNQVVGDVSTLTNYLACNLDTRSELVVLIRNPTTGQILGQIDVDGRKLNQFDAAEEAFITTVANLLAPYLVT